MEELLYDAKTLAGIIINRDMSIRASQKFLNDIWEYEKEYLYAGHRFHKKQFITDVMDEVDYWQNIRPYIAFDLSQEEDEQILDKGIFVGVDGCNGGWITAFISNGELSLKKYSDFSKMVFDTTQFDGMLVDMVIGLPSNIEQYEKRPDGIARKIVKPRTSTVFAVPTRQAVYEFTKDKQKDANLSAIGKGLSEQTIKD